jgi:hypothetical protein
MTSLESTGRSMDSLRQNEKDELEQRIIAYFEGSLDKEASSTLLADVAKTTEGRALFASHENLARIISAARIPLEAPMAVKEGIAARIPGLAAWIPGLIGTAQLAPVVSQSVNPIIAFLTKIPLSTAISVGTSVAVLTTATVVVKNKLDDNAAREHKAKIGVVQQASPTKPEAPLSPTLPQRDLATPDLGSANASFASDAVEKSEGTKATHKLALPTTKAPMRNITPSGTPSAKKGITQNVASTKSTPSNESAAPEAALPAISNVASLTSAPARPNILQPSSLAILPMLLGEGNGVRPFASIGTRVQSMVADKEFGENKSDGNVGYDARIGADISLIENLSLRVQAGYSQFAQDVEYTGFYYLGSQTVHQAYSTVKLNSAPWAMAGLSYRLYAGDAIPLTLSIGGGEAFLDKTSTMAEFGLSTELPLTNQFAVRPGLTYDAVWASSVDHRENGISGIVLDHRLQSQNSFSTSLGINLGFMYHY